MNGPTLTSPTYNLKLSNLSFSEIIASDCCRLFHSSVNAKYRFRIDFVKYKSTQSLKPAAPMLPLAG
jgi:hypothetical protein